MRSSVSLAHRVVMRGANSPSASQWVRAMALRNALPLAVVQGRRCPESSSSRWSSWSSRRGARSARSRPVRSGAVSRPESGNTLSGPQDAMLQRLREVPPRLLRGIFPDPVIPCVLSSTLTFPLFGHRFTRTYPEAINFSSPSTPSPDQFRWRLLRTQFACWKGQNQLLKKEEKPAILEAMLEPDSGPTTPKMPAFFMPAIDA